MKQLISHYSIGQIVMFTLLLAFAIKEIVSFLEWFDLKITAKVDKDRKTTVIQEQLRKDININKEQIKKLSLKEQEIIHNIDKIDKKLSMLIASDRDDIKAWITAQHHHFMQKGSIDYYSFECISRRYQHYKNQGGNTFVDQLMEDFYALPKTGNKIKHQ